MLTMLALCSLLTSTGPGQDPVNPVQRALDQARRDYEQGRDFWPDHSDWNNPWRVITGPYEVLTTRSFVFGRDAGLALEQMLGFYVDLLGRAPDPGTRFPVHIHPNLPAYNDVGNRLQEELASYHSSSYGCIVPAEMPGRPLVTYDPRSQEILYRFLTHGAVHQYLAACFPDRPRPLWIEEGLASYFTMYWDQSYTDRHTLRFQNIAAGDRFVPLENLIGLAPEALSEDVYTELAMLFHYLLSLREDTRTVWDEDGVVQAAPFRDYLRKVLSGVSVRGDPVMRFLQDRLGELEADFRSYPFG